MTVWTRSVDDPEVGRVQQFIRREPDGHLVGWEVYEDGKRSMEQALDDEPDEQLRVRGFRRV